jgi:polar amino acid transport system substrate-binding protein
MKKTMLVINLVFILVFSFTVNALAGPVVDRILQKGELVVGVSGNQPPLNAKAKDGEIIGLDADLAKLLAASMGVKATFSAMPFSELLPALEAGKVDVIVSGMTITPERNLKAAFVGPYFLSGKSIIAKIETVASWDEPSDLDNPETTLTALKGSTSQQFVEAVIPKAKLIAAKDYDEALQLVMDGKASAMVADFPFCMVASYRYKEQKLATTDKPFTYEPLGIALPPNDPLFINILDNFFMTLQGTGALMGLTERWFKDPSWMQRLP